MLSRWLLVLACCCACAGREASRRPDGVPSTSSKFARRSGPPKSPTASSAAPRPPPATTETIPRSGLAPIVPSPTAASSRRDEPAKQDQRTKLAVIEHLPGVLLRARALVENQGVVEVVEVQATDPIPAAVLRYRAAHPDWSVPQEYLALVAADPTEPLIFLLPSPPCGKFTGVQDVDGHGRWVLTLIEMDGGAHCSTGEQRAFELVAGQWKRLDPEPESVAFPQEVNGDGVPDFLVDFVAMHMGDCTWANCSSYAWQVRVPLYETWSADGKLSRDVAPFRAVYRQRFETALAAAKSPSSFEPEDQICAIGPLQLAAEIYVYGTLSGEPETNLLREVNRVMGSELEQPCERMASEPSLTWPEARDQMRNRVRVSLRPLL